jgi:hypothetical protein
MENRKLSIGELVQTDNWKRFMKKLEIISWILLGAVLLMKVVGYSENENFRLILTMTLTTFSILCFFIGLSKFDSDFRMLSILFYKIYGFGLSLGFITLLFIQTALPYPVELMTIISTIIIIISLFLGIRERLSENKNNINWLFFVRIFVALIPLIYFIIES